MARKSEPTLGIKILAIIIALLVWVYVFYQEGRAGNKVFHHVPIIPQNVPRDMILMDWDMNNLPTATIELFGSERVLENIDEDNILTYIDLLNSQAGSYQVDVECSFPSEKVRLSKTDPKTISIELQQVSTVELDIKYDYKGEPPAGITIEDPTFEPAKLKVTGPYSEISTLSNAYISIDLTGIKAGSNSYPIQFSLKTNTGTQIHQYRWEQLHLQPEHKTINAIIFGKRNVNAYSIATKLQTTGVIQSGYYIKSIDWKPKFIIIEGGHETLEDIDIITSQPLNLNRITKSATYTLPLVAPEGVELTDINSISVSVSVEKVVEKTLYAVMVNIAPDNVMYNRITETVDVRIKGPKSAVDKVNFVSASIDISGLSSGNHMLPVKIDGLPADVYLITVPTAEIVIP